MIKLLRRKVRGSAISYLIGLGMAVLCIGISVFVYMQFKTPEQDPNPSQDDKVLVLPDVMTVHDLAHFEFDVLHPDQTPLSDKTRALNGRHIKLTGFLRPLYASKDNREYLLVQDLDNHCRGHVPQVHHMVHVTIPETLDYNPVADEVIVSGILLVGIKRNDGRVKSIFRMTPKSVQLLTEQGD